MGTRDTQIYSSGAHLKLEPRPRKGKSSFHCTDLSFSAFSIPLLLKYYFHDEGVGWLVVLFLSFSFSCAEWHDGLCRRKTLTTHHTLDEIMK